MAEALLNKTKSMVTDHYQNANYLIQSFVFSTASELWLFHPCRGEGEGGGIGMVFQFFSCFGLKKSLDLTALVWNWVRFFTLA